MYSATKELTGENGVWLFEVERSRIHEMEEVTDRRNPCGTRPLARGNGVMTP